jgi:voltage-gated potassium channel
VPGRILAVLLMMGGVAIVGTATATIVSFLNDRARGLRERHANEKADRDDEPHT